MDVDFENDIFISYAHLDDQPLTEGQKGWVSDFHRALEIRLGELLGEKPKIWRDAKLAGNDYFSDVIVGRLMKVALLVSVLSPRYLKSEWCIKELREFYKAAEQTGGLRVGEKARVFKVVKTCVPREEYPQDLQALLGYEFYQIDKETGIPLEFNKILGREAEQYYWTKLYELAYHIRQLLVTIKKRKEVSSNLPAQLTGKTIYLAETTFDLYNERDKLKHELQQRGHIVLPDQPLPLNAPDFQRVVRENLERCTLSVHLVGKRYGMIPEAAEQSVISLQNELAAARSQENSAFSRLIWMPLGLEAQEQRQEEFIKSLQDAPELLQTNLEELKTIIQDKLNPRQKPAEKPIPEEGPVRVYLVYEQRDNEAIQPLDDYLFDQEFEVLKPLFEGDEAQVRQYHEDNLRLCDAVIIYYSNVNEPWLQAKLRELQKIAGYGRSKPMLAQAIYIGGAQTSQKQQFRTHEALVIKSFEAFSADLLKPFLTKIS